MAVSFSIVGCQEKVEEGHYEGNYYRKDDQCTSTIPIQLDVSYPSEFRIQTATQNVALLKITPSQSRETMNPIAVVKIKFTSMGNVRLDLSKIPGLDRYTLKPTPAKKMNVPTWCFASQGNVSVELCFTHSQFHLEVNGLANEPILELSGNKFKREEIYELEEPIVVDLCQSIDEAFKRNFDSKQAVESLVQAKNRALSAWLNLIPHFNVNVIGAIPFSVGGAVSAMNSVTPFLLPTTWISALNADSELEIERDALTILRSNLVFNLETLFYSFQRDHRIIEVHQGIRDHLKTLLLTQADPAGSLLKTLIDMVETSQVGFERVLREERNAISLSLGMRNPEGVENVINLPDEVPLADCKFLEKLKVAQVACQRSFELKQMDALIESAQTKKMGLYFAWLDPGGDPSQGLGFNLLGQDRVEKSAIKEIRIKREQTKTELFHDAYTAVFEFNVSLEEARKLPIPMAIDLKMEELSPLLEGFLTSDSQCVPDGEILKKWLNDVLGEWVRYESSMASYRIARSKIDRLMLRGYFEHLLPQLRINEEPSSEPGHLRVR